MKARRIAFWDFHGLVNSSNWKYCQISFYVDSSSLNLLHFTQNIYRDFMFIPITLAIILWCILKLHIPKQIGKTNFNNTYLF